MNFILGLKYQNDKKEGRWTNKPSEGTDKGGDPTRRRPKCILCRKEGHTLTRCFIFERAQKILKTNYNDRKVRDFKRINNKDKEDRRLEELKVKFMNEIDWADIPEDSAVNMAINCLLDEEELYEIDHISAEGSEEESGNDRTGHEDYYESGDEEEESDD